VIIFNSIFFAAVPEFAICFNGLALIPLTWAWFKLFRAQIAIFCLAYLAIIFLLCGIPSKAVIYYLPQSVSKIIGTVPPFYNSFICSDDLKFSSDLGTLGI